VQDVFAISAFEDWFESNRHVFQRFTLREELADSARRVSNIQIDTPTYMVSLCAWDQGDALEIQIIDLATEKTSIEDGPCSTKGEMLARLDGFLTWFNRQHE